MDEVAQLTCFDKMCMFSDDMRDLMPRTIDHWLSHSVNPEILVNFDEPVTILDVVLKPKYNVTDAPSQFMQSLEEGQFKGVEPSDFFFRNLVLSKAGRMKPEEMIESFKSIK